MLPLLPAGMAGELRLVDGHRHIESDDKVTLKLTEWERASTRLPPVTTVTLYEGAASVEYLRNRVARMLERNPWLASRVVKSNTVDGVLALEYSATADVKRAVDRHFFVYEAGDVGLSLRMQYEDLVRCVFPIQCARTRPATDVDEVLFKVAVVPIAMDEGGEEPDHQGAPLQRAVSLPGYALVVSMNHTLGDGHTYYQLFGMLSADAEVEALNPIRVAGFEEAKADIIGEEENALFSSVGISLGIVGRYVGGKVRRRRPQNVCVHKVDPEWVAHEKSRANRQGAVPFISANDALTSWFFREMGADINYMIVNLRSRQPSILGLSDHNACNCEANVPYFPGDVETPALIRQSIRNEDGTFRARRAGSPKTDLPSFRTRLHSNVSFATNLATLSREVRLPDNGQSGERGIVSPNLHLPIMAPDGVITSIWNSAVLFRPRAGELAMLLVTRKVDSEGIARQKAQNGRSYPLAERIV